MAQVKNSVSASKDALAAIFGRDSAKAEVQSEPPSGAQGEGTVDEPFDKGNAPDQVPEANSTSPSDTQAAQPPESKPVSHLESVMGKKEEKPKTEESPSTATATATPAPVSAPVEEKKKEEPPKQEESRGRKEWPSTRAGQQERSVSPGTMPDGSHATTSGDKGESYTTPKGLGKLKGKVFGK